MRGTIIKAVLAPALGSGPVAWSALLAVALGALAAGNLLGGWLAERCVPSRLVPWLSIVAATGLVAFSRTYVPVMHWAASLSLVQGAVVAAMCSQVLPVGALGALTPSLLARGNAACPSGRWAGAILAAGSVGGIAGALAVALVLLPHCGIARSYLLLSMALAGSALPLATARRQLLTALLLAAVLGSAAWCAQARPPSEPLQSQFSELEIVANRETKLLLIDGLPQTGLPAPATRAGLRPGEGLRYGYLLEAALLTARR
jgi:predicted membrane-bound spermidine synthase